MNAMEIVAFSYPAVFWDGPHGQLRCVYIKTLYCVFLVLKKKTVLNMVQLYSKCCNLNAY